MPTGAIIIANLTDITGDQLKELALSVLEDAKAEDIRTFDLRDRSTISDYMIVASGNSTRQVRAMAERLMIKSKEHGNPPLGTEGERDGEWALVDLNDVVIHLMLPRVRAFYNLEKLWDAPVPAGQSSRAGA